MAKNSFSCALRLLGVGVCLFLIHAGTPLGFKEAHAQRFTMSLEDLDGLYPDSPLDTVKVPIETVTLGLHHRVPNFLDEDLTRERQVVEYSLYAPIRLTFRHSVAYRFEFQETRDGSYFVMTPRDLAIPGLSIRVESVDSIAEGVREQSLQQVWKETSLAAINRQVGPRAARKGLLNINLPVDLPDAVESIIGSGEATNIDISGRQSITFAGESRRVNPFIGSEGQTKQSLFPSLDLRQELDVRLNGQIGEKINIQVDHSNSTLGAQSDNRIRLNYTGFEDDIIQLIEMGNTSLSLPGSQLVSFSGSSQGLFGIKALAQIGPNKLTMIASKEEGESSRATFTPRGGQIGQTEIRTINDSDFIRNTYFFLDAPTSQTFFGVDEGALDVFESVEPYEIGNDPTIVAFWGRAWVDTLGHGDDIRNAIFLRENGMTPPPSQEKQFRLLDVDDDYRFVRDVNTLDIIGIELVRPVTTQRALAVRYINAIGDTIGNYGNLTDTLALELIKPQNENPNNEFGYTWQFMMRHIYSLQLSSIDRTTLDIEIRDFIPGKQDQSVPTGSSVPWLRIFGLDQTNPAGGSPDNRIDLDAGWIDYQRGTLTFPILTPFNPPDDSVAAWTGGQFAFTDEFESFRRPELYTSALNDIVTSPKFEIYVSASSTSRTFNLNAFNISPGSETVHLDGRELVRNRDYTIDYETGEVELQGTVLDELNPSSNIQVDYEFKPFIGGGSSSLIGFNNLLQWSDNATFGTTWLYESKSSAATKPRLGEEPTRTIVGNVNGAVNYNPHLLTKLVNVLPLVDTDARSSLSLNGEIAMSMPDPNTLGEVYIDDFEGVEDSDLISLARRSWQWASVPVDPSNTSLTLDPTKRLPIFWYNIEPERDDQKTGVTKRDLNPNLDERESTIVQSLDIEFDTLATDTTYWGGVMAGFRGGGLDLSQGQFLEFWVNDFRGADSLSRGGTLHIDMGSIDENFYQPETDKFNTEDADFDGFVALTEDTGLDGIADGDPGDDPNDNWDLSRLPEGDPNGRFLRINGTENNQLFDSEDLDGTGSMERTNSYFSFSVDLASTPVTDIRKEFPNNARLREPPHANDSWRLYRIKLTDRSEVAPLVRPSLDQIKHIRIWIQNTEKTLVPSIKRLQIAELKIVGNRWERDGIRTLSDSLLTGPDTRGAVVSLGVISNKTDPVDYRPPFIPNQENDISEREQSLLVQYDSLQTGQSFKLRRRFAGRGMDFNNYRDAHLWVHTNEHNPDLDYFFQIAIDSLNYYEISIPMTDTNFSATNWVHAYFLLSDLTQLKLSPTDTTFTAGTMRDLIENRSYNTRMVGNPSLFNVRYLYAGVRNRSTQAVSGQIWVNDIFLGDRRRDIDYAGRIAGSISFANVISFTGSFGYSGPDFRGLRQTRGSGATNQDFAFSAKTSLQHFIPLLGFAIPVTANYNRRLSLPKFTPNSDTELRDDFTRRAFRSETVTRGFSTTLTRQGSKNPLLRYTFDKLKVNFSASESMGRTPSSADTALSMNGTVDYSITWSPRRTWNLFKNVRFRYWLNSLNLRANATRRTATRYRNVAGAFVRDPDYYDARIGTSMQANYVPFQSFTTSFRMNVDRDYSRPHEVHGIDIGTETGRSLNFQANYKVPRIWLIGAFQPDLNFNSRYSENSGPEVRRQGDPPGVKNVNNSRDASVKMNFDIGKYFKRFFSAINLAEKQPPPPVPQSPPPGGQAAPDTAAVDEPEKDAEDEGVDKLILLRKIGGVFSRMRRIDASFSQRFGSNYSRIPRRPSFLYQFSVSEDSGVDIEGLDLSEPERTTTNNSLVLNSGVQITKNIDLAARFSLTTSDNSFRASESNTKNVVWPDVNVSWTGLEQYGPLNGVFSASSATVGYRSTKRETGQAGSVNSTDKSRSITPALVFTWKNGINTNLSMSLQTNTNEIRGSFNETDSKSFNLEMKYAFKPGKTLKIPLPFLRNKTLSSSLNTSLTIGYTVAGGKRSILGSPVLRPVPKRTTLRVAPRATYNFTRALNGGLFVDYNRSFSEATNQTITTVRVGIDATFTF